MRRSIRRRLALALCGSAHYPSQAAIAAATLREFDAAIKKRWSSDEALSGEAVA